MKKYCKDVLATFLSNANRIAVICLGNEFRKDDAAGIFFCKELQEKNIARVILFYAYSSPEAYILKISEDAEISHVLIVDAVDAGFPPGEILILEPSDFSEDTLSTHRISLSYLLQFLKKAGKKILIIGIQPHDTSIGEGVHEEILKSIKRLIRDFLHCLQNNS
ncbi:MAG: hydrogenase maturation protease [Candidatus Njordarchaeales archaeon]